MKHLLLLFVLAFSFPAFSQITKDSVVGTWIYVDNKGVEQKLEISKDSVSVIFESQSEQDSNEWITFTTVGIYTIEKGDQIHVIFNDNPREEAFYKVVRAKDGTLQIEIKASDKKKDPPYVYKRR